MNTIMRVKTLLLLFVCSIFCAQLNAQTVLDLPDFKIENRTTFVISQVEAATTLSTRLMVSLTKNDYKPVGLRVEAGATLKLNVSVLSGTLRPKLVTFTREYGDVTTYNLSIGDNTIFITKTGNIYLQFSSATPMLTNNARVTFQSGYSQIPFYQMGITTNADWQTMLADATSPDAILLSNRAYVVIKKSNADASKTKNQNLLLEQIDKIVQLESDISGLDGSLPEHQPFTYSQLMIHDKDSGNPDATSFGRVRIPQGSIKWITDPDYVTADGGWGLMHEIGHQHQQHPYNWTSNTEVHVNIHSLAAKRYFFPGQNGISNTDWTSTLNYLEKNADVKDYDASTTENFVKLCLYHQLWLAFGGDAFYQNLYKKIRIDKPAPTTNEGERQVLLVTASQVAGKDLSNFFKRWGINATVATYNNLAALNLPQPTIDPSSFSESWVVKKKSLLQDTTVLEGNSIKIALSALAPTGVKRVQFYNGNTLLAETTSLPFEYNWQNISKGIHSVYAKVIADDDTFQQTESVNVSVVNIGIAAPINNSFYLNDADIELTPYLVNPAVVNKIEYYEGNTKIGEATTAPFSYIWTSAPRGSYILKAKAYYNNTTDETSEPVIITVGGLFPYADAYVRDGSYTGNNYGTENGLVVKKDGAGFTRETYLRFKLSDISQGSFAKATLKLSTIAANANVANKTDWQLYFVANDTWDETTINYNNKPVAGDLLATVRSVAGGVVEWDITNQLNTELSGDKNISLLLVSSTVGSNYDITFASKENTNVALRPVLQLYTQQEIDDLTPPITTVTSPSTFYEIGSNVQVVATTTIKVTDPIQKIEFYANGNKVGEATVSPYQCTINNMARGVYNIMAKAIYQSGAESSSETISIGVGNLSPFADAYVHGGNKSTNYGAEDKLVVKNDGTSYYRETFLRFKLTDITQSSFAKAVLRLNITGANTNVTINNNAWQLYFIADDSWTETSINYNNRPTTKGALLATVPAIKTGSVEWDITNQLNVELTGDKYISLLLVATVANGTSDVTFASKENTNTALRPILQLYTAEDIALPINCNMLKAKLVASGIQLNWNTQAENNSKDYQIWRSVNGKDFKQVVNIASKNDKNGANYQFTDVLSATGLYYYKLTNTDYDGTVNDVCNPVSMNFTLDNAPQLIIYPNPVKEKLNLKPKELGLANVVITDILGKTYYRKEHLLNTTIEINVANLPRGTYYVNIQGRDKNTTKCFVKVN